MDETFGDAMNAARETSEGVSDRIGEMAGKASNKINDMAGRTSSKVKEMAGTASSKVDDGLNYLRSRNFSEIAEDAQDLVRKYPAGSLLAAVAIGFMAAHYLRSNRHAEYE